MNVRPTQRALSTWALAAALVGCGGERGDAAHDASEYPDGPYALERGAVLPDLHFPGVDADGSPTTLTLADFYTREHDALLVVTVSGGLWCGTCRWPAEAELFEPTTAARAQRLDLVLADRDNAPADAAAAAAWKEAFDGLGAVPVGADPAHHFAALLEDPSAPLPWFVLVDTRTMRVLDAITDSSRAALGHRVRSALAERGVLPAPPPLEEPLVDDMFREHEWALLQRTTVPGEAPPEPSNAVASSPAAATLGRALFFDAGLSPSGRVSCASCHRPEAQLSDGRPRAEGVGLGDRRTPPIALSAHARWQHWDGRADSLWAQALGPLENPLEMGASRAFVARRVLTAHGAAYRAAFPDAPAPDPRSWPPSGMPGDSAYDALPAAEREAITQLFVHAGKAIAAWERTLTVADNRLDAYLAGDLDALDADEKYGLQLFVKSGCMQCHWGPRLTDDAFHNLRLPSGRADGSADPGRSEGLRAFRASEFRSDGRWSDAGDDEVTARAERAEPDALLGQFKTPPLRGVAELVFFGHGGSAGDLASVMESYGWGGVPADDLSSAGERERWLPPLSETVQWGLLPFLRVLTGEPVLR